MSLKGKIPKLKETTILSMKMLMDQILVIDDKQRKNKSEIRIKKDDIIQNK